MKGTFAIDAQWLPAAHGSPEERATTAELSITAGSEVLTTVEDGWAHSVRYAIRVSAWPLACWLVDSWWRLRWEVAHGRGEPGLPFRMSHDLASVGSGYLWPRISLLSDGEGIDVIARPSRRVLAEPVRFLSDSHQVIEIRDFERGVTQFVELVLARLDALGHRKTVLHTLWADLQAERSDPSAEAYRRLEAQLGYDPDEADSKVITAFERAEKRIGKGAVLELAAISAGERPIDSLKAVTHLSEGAGIQASFDSVRKLGRALSSPEVKKAAPGPRGKLAAQLVRAKLSLGEGPVTTQRLGDLLGGSLPERGDARLVAAPLSLGVRTNVDDAFKLIFRKRTRTGIRFEAARFLADFVTASNEDRWLPLTDAASARQKFQRSFAAEFLAPIDSLTSRLDGDFSESAIDAVSDEFNVSALTVLSSLANNGVIPPEQVALPGGS